MDARWGPSDPVAPGSATAAPPEGGLPDGSIVRLSLRRIGPHTVVQPTVPHRVSPQAAPPRSASPQGAPRGGARPVPCGGTLNLGPLGATTLVRPGSSERGGCG
ncbi:hypothetical protein GCM10009660_34340 [Catellatospora bangladeshensis]